jgi:hypothetical protein
MRNIIWSLLLIAFSLDILKRAFFEKEPQRSLEEKAQPTEEIKSFNQQNLTSTKISDSENENQINEVDQSENLEKIVLDINYCSTSHAKQFEEFKKDLGNYNNIEVRGTEYPINPIRKLLSKGLYFLQMAMMVILVGGSTVRGYLTFIPDRVFNLIEEKKFLVGIFNFFIIGQLTSYLNSTGAFEISMNGQTVKIFI